MPKNDQKDPSFRSRLLISKWYYYIKLVVPSSMIFKFSWKHKVVADLECTTKKKGIITLCIRKINREYLIILRFFYWLNNISIKLFPQWVETTNIFLLGVRYIIQLSTWYSCIWNTSRIIYIIYLDIIRCNI
jgi:hypothetical protein